MCKHFRKSTMCWTAVYTAPLAIGTLVPHRPAKLWCIRFCMSHYAGDVISSTTAEGFKRARTAAKSTVAGVVRAAKCTAARSVRMCFAKGVLSEICHMAPSSWSKRPKSGTASVALLKSCGRCAPLTGHTPTIWRRWGSKTYSKNILPKCFPKFCFLFSGNYSTNTPTKMIWAVQCKSIRRPAVTKIRKAGIWSRLYEIRDAEESVAVVTTAKMQTRPKRIQSRSHYW